LPASFAQCESGGGADEVVGGWAAQRIPDPHLLKGGKQIGLEDPPDYLGETDIDGGFLDRSLVVER
jgi:hypothetical protein